MAEAKLRLIYEYDDDYGLTSAAQLNVDDVPLGCAVEDIYGETWVNSIDGFRPPYRGETLHTFDPSALLRSRYPNTVFDR